MSEKMDPELKAKWVAALRSGEYKQGTGRLRKPTADGQRFCCLGVLCEVVGIPRLDDRDGGTAGYKCGLSGSDCLLPMRVPGVDAYSQGKLASMNDGGSTFYTIADYIEENL